MNTAPRHRLLVVGSTFPARPGDGTPSFVRDLSLVLAQQFDTEVLVPRVSGAPRLEQDAALTVRRFPYFWRRHEDLANGAIIENLRSKRTRWLQVLPFLAGEGLALRRAIRRSNPDVIHIHWVIPQGLVAWLVARSRPWLLTVHGGDLYALARFDQLKARVLRRAALVTVMNTQMRDRVIELGVAADRVVVAPMGADISDLTALAAGEERDRSRVLFVGRLVEKKGVAVLIDALRSLPGDVSWQLDIAGDGPLRAALEAQAAGLPVTFHGQVGRAQLVALLARAGIVAIPSVRAASGDQDGRPVVVAEALAAGCCVVASALPGLDEVVDDGSNGFLVPPGDVDRLAQTLRRVLEDQALQRRIEAAAAASAAAISVEAVGAAYAAMIMQVAERPRDTPG